MSLTDLVDWETVRKTVREAPLKELALAAIAESSEISPGIAAEAKARHRVICEDRLFFRSLGFTNQQYNNGDPEAFARVGFYALLEEKYKDIAADDGVVFRPETQILFLQYES